MRASAQGECQCNNPFHLIPTFSSTRAGAHATHKTAQQHRDVVEGPFLRPQILQQPMQYWHHRNHVLHEDADSRMVYDKQYRHSSPLVVTWPTRRSRLNPQTALHHDCGTPQQHTQIAHSQLAHSAPTTRVVAIPVRDLLRYEVAYTSTSTVLYDIGVVQSTQLVHFLFCNTRLWGVKRS